MFDLIDFHDYQDRDDFGLDGSPVDFPVGTRKIAAVGKADKHLALPSHKAVIGYRGGRVVPLGVVGEGYKVVPHTDYFGVIEAALRGSIRPDLRDGHKVRTQLANDGAWARRDYVFPAFGGKLRNTEFATEIGLRIVAFNSYDGTSSAGLAVGMLDFFCTNGMIVGKVLDQSKRRHTSGFTPDYFVPMLTKALGQIQGHVRRIEAMMASPLDEAAAEKLLSNHFSERRAAQLLERTREEISVRGANVFALQSAMTYYASHNSEAFKVRQTGNDNVARTLMAREEEVRKVIEAPDFEALIAA